MNADESLPLMTWRARPDMSCERVSQAWLDFTGLTQDAGLGEGVHPEDLARWLDTYVRAFDEREPFEIEYRLRRHDGEYRWVVERAAPVYSEHGSFLGYSGACVDIEEQKRQQQGLAQALERERQLRVVAEETSRLRQGVTISVLQGLQLPAQAIATWAGQLCRQVPDSSEAGQALRSIEHKAREQSRVISGLLDVAQAAATQPSATRNGEGAALLSGVKVLVVDPDRGTRETLLRMLGVAGADVRAVASTIEALTTLGAWQPDVLLSGEGDSLIRALRSLPTDGPSAAFRRGYDAQLSKPVEPVALLATVARLAA